MGSRTPNCLRTAINIKRTTPTARISMPWIPIPNAVGRCSFRAPPRPLARSLSLSVSLSFQGGPTVIHKASENTAQRPIAQLWARSQASVKVLMKFLETSWKESFVLRCRGMAHRSQATEQNKKRRMTVLSPDDGNLLVQGRKRTFFKHCFLFFFPSAG